MAQTTKKPIRFMPQFLCHASRPDAPREVSKFRRSMPQIFVTLVKNLLLLDLGLSFSIITIIMPAVRGINTDNDVIKLSDGEATTMAAVAFIGQPVGSFMSGWVFEPIGRRPALFLSNVPHLIAWILMALATQKWHLFTAVVLTGFGCGIMEAPVMTYVSEIAEPRLRSILLTLSMMSAMLGYFCVYLMGALVKWRTAAAICAICPITAMVALLFVPETPYWLLTNGHEDESLQALCWLRGWVHPDAVDDEMEELRVSFVRENLQHSSLLMNKSCREQLRELCQPSTLRPFMLIVVLFLGIQFGGYSSVRPYMVQVFATMQFPLRAVWATIGVAVFGLIGAMMCTVCITWAGKRKIYFITASLDLLSLLILAIQAGLLPAGANSFNKPLPPLRTNSSIMEWVSMIAMFGLALNSALGIYTITYNLLGEIFPYRTRGIAAGIACSVNYLLSFTVTKTFLWVEKALTLCGVFCLYMLVTALCILYCYFYMPVTENRKLSELEEFYLPKITTRRQSSHLYVEPPLQKSKTDNARKEPGLVV